MKSVPLGPSVVAVIPPTCPEVLAVSPCPFAVTSPGFLRAPCPGCWHRGGDLSDSHCCPSSCWIICLIFRIICLIFNSLHHLSSSFLTFFFCFFSHRCTLISLKKHLSSSYPEPCQMKSTSKNQVNTIFLPKIYLKQYIFFGKAALGGSHRRTWKRKCFLSAAIQAEKADLGRKGS